MSKNIDRMFELIFGRSAHEIVATQAAKSKLYSGPDTANRFDVMKRRNKWGKTNPIMIPVHTIEDKPMYHLGKDGKEIIDKGKKLPITVPLYNTFLENDVAEGRVKLEAFRFIDISALLRDKTPDEQALVIKHAIQSGLHQQLMSCKKGNAVDIPVRLLVCSDLEYAKTRNCAFFTSPQDLIAYGKALVTSHETIATGDFRFTVVKEGDLGTGDGQSRISIPLARELGYEGFGHIQIRLELAGKYLVTGSALISTLGKEVDFIIPDSNFKGGHTPEIGKVYQYNGRLGVMMNAADRNLKIRDNFEVQHYYRDLEWDMVDARAEELVGAHRDPKRYLEVVGDTEPKEEDFTTVNSLLKSVTPVEEDSEAQYVAGALMHHYYVASKVHDFILSKYADLATCANHYFDGAYLACLEELPDDHAYVRGSAGTEWVFRIPMLSAGNIIKLKMVSEDDLYGLLNGDSVHDAEILAVIYNRGSIFVNSATAAKLNSDFDMDPMCRCPESDPYYKRMTEVKSDWGSMELTSKDKTRKRSQWNRFGASDAVADFIAAPNIGSLTLLQDNILMRRSDPRAVSFCKNLSLNIKSAAELTGMLTQVAVDSHKWTARLEPEEVSVSGKLMKYFTGKSPFHRNIISEIRAGNTDWDVEPEHHLDKLVQTVRDAQAANNLGDIMESFSPGSYVGFLGIPSPAILEDLRPEVLERVSSYNKSIAAVLSQTKEGSRHRDDAIAKICEVNRMDFAYMRQTMTIEAFRDYVRLAWDAAHQAASRSTNKSKASFIFTAGVIDVVVDCLNEVYGGFGAVSASYSELKAGEVPAPRIRLFDGWKMHIPYHEQTSLLKKAFKYEDEDAKARISEAMQKWAAQVKGKVTVGIRTTMKGYKHYTCLFSGKSIVGDIRTSLIELGAYEVTDVTVSGVQLIVSLRPIIDEPKVSRHKMKVVRLWQNDASESDSKAKKAERTVSIIKESTRLVTNKVVPGDRGVDLIIRGKVVASIMSSSVDESVVLGKVKIVDVIHEPGTLSATIIADRVHS